MKIKNKKGEKLKSFVANDLPKMNHSNNVSTIY